VGAAFGDGGKFICGIKTVGLKGKDCLVYSIGSNYDTSFETSMRKVTQCEMHTFDPTIDPTLLNAVAAQHNFTVHDWGLGATEGPLAHERHNGTVMPFPNVLKRLGHENKTIDILKIDCEGCEFTAMQPLFDGCQAKHFGVGQLQVELHGTDFKQIRAFFEAADRCGLMIFHKERNHWGCNGYTCVEFSLISNNSAWEAFRHSHSCP
jgi:hypothetical protein